MSRKDRALAELILANNEDMIEGRISLRLWSENQMALFAEADDIRALASHLLPVEVP